MVSLTREALLAQRERQGEQRQAAGDDWSDTGYVFTTRTGRPVEPRNVTRSFDRIIAETGLPKIAFHGSHAAQGPWRPSPRRSGDPRPLPHQRHPRHLQRGLRRPDQHRPRPHGRSPRRPPIQQRPAPSGQRSHTAAPHWSVTGPADDVVRRCCQKCGQHHPRRPIPWQVSPVRAIAASR
jgi:hypothetical protein